MNNIYPPTTAKSNLHAKNDDMSLFRKLTLNAVKTTIRLFKLPLIRMKTPAVANALCIACCATDYSLQSTQAESTEEAEADTPGLTAWNSAGNKSGPQDMSGRKAQRAGRFSYSNKIRLRRIRLHRFGGLSI